MKRFLMCLSVCFLLAACDPYSQETTGKYEMPKELSDKGCRIYFVDGKGVLPLRVVYCPGAQTSTTYKVGKNSVYVATIGGE